MHTSCYQGLVESGRGVTDQNYVDVMNIVNLPEDVVTAHCVSKKMFGHLSSGQDYVTTLQVSRLVHDQLDIPRIVLDKQKYSEDDITELCCQYMRSEMPSMSLHTSQSVSEKIGGLLFIIPLLSTVLYLYQLSSLTLSLWSSWRTFIFSNIMFFLTVSSNRSLTRFRRFKIWSQIFGMFSDKAESGEREEKYLADQLSWSFHVSSLFLILVLHQSSENNQQTSVLSLESPHLALIIITGAALAALNLQSSSRSFILLLSFNILLSISKHLNLVDESIIDYLPTEVLNYESKTILQFLSLTSITLYLLVSKQSSTVILESQALLWEFLMLNLISEEEVMDMILLILILVLLVSIRQWKYVSPALLLLTYYLIANNRLPSQDDMETMTVIIVMLMMIISVITKKSNLKQKLITGVVSMLVMCSMRDHLTRDISGDHSTMTWAQFRSVCPAGDHHDLCPLFSGRSVSWSGEVDTVTLVSRINMLEEAVSLLPGNLRQITNIDCVLGER